MKYAQSQENDDKILRKLDVTVLVQRLLSYLFQEPAISNVVTKLCLAYPSEIELRNCFDERGRYEYLCW